MEVLEIGDVILFFTGYKTLKKKEKKKSNWSFKLVEMITGTPYDSDASIHTIRNEVSFFPYGKNPFLSRKKNRNEKKNFFSMLIGMP